MKIRARREGGHRLRNESALHPRVRLELPAGSFWARGLSLPSQLSGLPTPKSPPAVYPGSEPPTSPRREMFQLSQARQGLQLTGFNWIMYLSICNALSSLKSTCPHREALPVCKGLCRVLSPSSLSISCLLRGLLISLGQLRRLSLE